MGNEIKKGGASNPIRQYEEKGREILSYTEENHPLDVLQTGPIRENQQPELTANNSSAVVAEMLKKRAESPEYQSFLERARAEREASQNKGSSPDF